MSLELQFTCNNYTCEDLGNSNKDLLLWMHTQDLHVCHQIRCVAFGDSFAELALFRYWSDVNILMIRV